MRSYKELLEQDKMLLEKRIEKFNKLMKENQELKQEINDKILDSKVDPVFICGGRGIGKSFFGSTEGQLFTENVELKDTNADLLNTNETLRIMNNNVCEQMKELEKRHRVISKQNNRLATENETVLNDNIVLGNMVIDLIERRR